jgi:hypothetical protein
MNVPSETVAVALFLTSDDSCVLMTNGGVRGWLFRPDLIKGSLVCAVDNGSTRTGNSLQGAFESKLNSEVPHWLIIRMQRA